MMILRDLLKMCFISVLPSSLLIWSLIATSTASLTTTPPTHSLLTATLSAFGLWIYGVSQTGFTSQVGDSTASRRTTCWVIGGLFTLVKLCQRTSSAYGLLWVYAVLPLSLYAARMWRLEKDILLGHTAAQSLVERYSGPAERNILLLTLLGLFTLGNSYMTVENVTLGLSSASFTVAAYEMLESLLPSTSVDQSLNEKDAGSLEGLLSGDATPSRSRAGTLYTCIRDISAAITIGCGLSSIWFESLPSETFSGHTVIGSGIGVQCIVLIGACLAQAAGTVVVFVLISRHLILECSLGLMGAAFACQILTHLSVTSIWFGSLACLTSIVLFREKNSIRFNDDETSTYRKYHRGLSVMIGVSFIVGLALQLFYFSPIQNIQGTKSISFHSEQGQTQITSVNQIHPVEHLMTKSRNEFGAVLKGQSRSLKEAVAEYKERYRRFPPPNFDKWYEFAKEHHVQMIDEYDTIFHNLQPFWALEPSILRERVREAIGFDENALLAVEIRNGAVAKLEGGEQWQMDATLGMLQSFVRYLPDMDLAFNTHNEPRVVVPHDLLSRMVALANSTTLTAEQQNAFSTRSRDLNDGKEIEEFKTSRFNSFPHQKSWASSSISCHPDSPARNVAVDSQSQTEDGMVDNLTFVTNQTAFTDICQSPWLSESHGFFERPNVYKVTHDLVPLFSESKVSSFQDILYPSPWYWYGKYPQNGTDVMHVDGNEQYVDSADVVWDNKNETLWWRGSNTGGYSKYGSWRHYHRQKIVQNLNGWETTQTMTKSSSDSTAEWKATAVPKSQFRDRIDVKFTAIGQCDPEDCHAQEEYFNVVPASDFKKTWRSKYLLDMDGNAFSGRFYSLLKSHSMVLKMAVFREWHEEWLKPWLHYVPLTLRGAEAFEVLRYFTTEDEGKEHAQQMAHESREWANKALRRKDMEAWFFRLLLEYGRVMDENRMSIGYPG